MSAGEGIAFLQGYMCQMPQANAPNPGLNPESSAGGKVRIRA